MQRQDNSIQAILEINKESEIFKGHFPGQPILPGACMLQLVKEVLSISLGFHIRLLKAEYLKFLKLINPLNNNIIQLTLSFKELDNSIYVIAILISDKVIFFKLKGSFIAE